MSTKRCPDVLLVSMDQSLIAIVQELLSSVDGLRLDIRAGIEEAYRHLGHNRVALVLLHLPDTQAAPDVTAFLQLVAAARPPIPTLVLSERHDAEQALALLRAGATDYLSRPLDLTRLAFLLDVLTVSARYGESARGPGPDSTTVKSLGAEDPFLYVPTAEIGRLMEQVHRVAPRDTTLLFQGETGTGKTRLARLVHELSPRRHEPFVVVDCGVLSANLIESEIFGHVRGAFTGGDRDRIGKFAEAGRGTLLLDEIDALPPALQTKLLRVVDERVFEPVGANKPQPLQARLIAATNRSLEKEVAGGRFRADLYYRLNVVAFTLPPLRERRELIPSLADRFVTEFAARNGRQLNGIAPEALRALQAYPWPGNIRELRNVIERLVVLCAGPLIQLEDMPATIRGCPMIASLDAAPPTTSCPSVPVSTLIQTKEEAELARIRAALQNHRNNRHRVAAELGISRMTLYRKLRKYGLGDAFESPSN